MIIQHCDLLDKGMTEWENWREEFPEQRPILNWIVRPEAELRYFDLSSASMCGANFEGSDFEKSDCAGADFSGANLSGSSFANTNCEAASFKGCNLENVNFKGAHLKGATFFGANLKGCDFRDASLDGVDFTGAILTEAHFEGTTMMEVNMSYADMSNAQLSSEESPIRVKRTVFEEVDLRHAILKGANLMGVVFQGVNFSESMLSGISLGRTIFADCNLSGAIGLTEIDHIEPSTIGLDTLLRSEGEIPESFMVDAGVPEAFVEILTGNQTEPQEELDEPVLSSQGFVAKNIPEPEPVVVATAAQTDEHDDDQHTAEPASSAQDLAAQQNVEQELPEETVTQDEPVVNEGVEVSEPSWPFAEQDDSGLAQALADAERPAEDNEHEQDEDTAEDEIVAASHQVENLEQEEQPVMAEPDQSEPTNDVEIWAGSDSDQAVEASEATQDEQDTEDEAETAIAENTLTGLETAVSS